MQKITKCNAGNFFSVGEYTNICKYTNVKRLTKNSRQSNRKHSLAVFSYLNIQAQAPELCNTWKKLCRHAG